MKLWGLLAFIYPFRNKALIVKTFLEDPEPEGEQAVLHPSKEQGQCSNIMMACILRGYFDLESFVLTLEVKSV